MITVEVVWSPEPRRVVAIMLELPPGSTLLDAMQAAAKHPDAASWPLGRFDAGIWGKRRPLSTPLAQGDRVEAYRELQCDPKEARRRRYRQSTAPAGRSRRARPG